MAPFQTNRRTFLCFKRTAFTRTHQAKYHPFEPSCSVDLSSFEESSSSLSTNDVMIETGDGKRASLNLHEDDLVIMLGDGINQIVNLINSFTFHATLHAVRVSPQSSKHESRVWYGRMVLPPTDAIHPKDSPVTFGEWFIMPRQQQQPR